MQSVTATGRNAGGGIVDTARAGPHYHHQNRAMFPADKFRFDVVEQIDLSLSFFEFAGRKNVASVMIPVDDSSTLNAEMTPAAVAGGVDVFGTNDAKTLLAPFQPLANVVSKMVVHTLERSKKTIAFVTVVVDRRPVEWTTPPAAHETSPLALMPSTVVHDQSAFGTQFVHGAAEDVQFRYQKGVIIGDDDVDASGTVEILIADVNQVYSARRGVGNLVDE